MKLILNENIDNLGFKNDVVTVKNGYGRNYLVPKGLAKMATDSALKMLAENLKQQSVKNKKVKDEAEKTAEKLTKLVLKIGAKAGENGKIFGSINTLQIAEAAEKQGVILDKKLIKLKGDAIKSLGNYEAEVKLHKEVDAIIKFEVVEE
ncbi:MAG: 50S ribosomal protein L9 [Bacteroidetes bacterium HGW-Bacteroidetes-12]|nr:MAG: 50S ribosomal protein L9 [Bacteroidetes bacterium HGW-Bacteroidetes-12]